MFYNSFLQIITEDEVRRYLRDLLTIQEIDELSERLFVADMLRDGQTYEAIATRTSMSTATIARVSKWLKNGRRGYSLVLGRLHHTPTTHL